MLEILDKYKVNPKVLEHLQKQARDQNDADLNIFEPKLETKRHLMNKEKGFYVQHRREYYNDFEDCLRDYKNAKIKSLQKQTKVHLSDGDNGESDSEYVDCTDAGDLKLQSNLSSKSMPHVPTGNYQDSFCQQLEPELTTKHNETEAQTQTQTAQKAQLYTNYGVLQIEHETSAQLTSHNNNHNQIIDTSSSTNSPLAIKVGSKVSEKEKSIAIDDNIAIPSTSSTDDIHVNQSAADKPSKSVEVAPSPVKIAPKRDEQSKRKSCKKKLDGAAKDPTQR